jgi:23S rRNA (guanosine2251-2'-O)-methyltransferase
MAKAGAGIRISGINAVEGAIAAGKARTLFIKGAPSSPRIARLLDEARKLGLRVASLKERDFRSRFPEARQGIGADADPVDLSDVSVLLEEPPEGVILALDHWEDPQNFGAVLRTAAAFGVKAVIYPSRRSAPISPAVYSASAGYLYRVRLVEVPNLRYALERLQKHGWWTVGLSADGTDDLSEEHLASPVIIVVGAEGGGLSELVARSVDRRLRVPMASGVDSLNAGVAAAIALHLAARAANRSAKSVK